MKGEEKLWSILNDKLDTLRAGNRLPEAIRVAETALEIAKRAFPGAETPLATSFEKLGQLLDQQGNRTAAKGYLLKAHAILEKIEPADQRAIFRSARRLAFLCDSLGQTEEAVRFYEKAFAAGGQLEDLPYSDLGTMLNNVALIFRKSGRQKAAEPYYLHALEIYEKQLGPDHEDVASVLNNLAVFYTNERRYTEAEKIHLRALGIREKVHPRNRNATWRWCIIHGGITRRRLNSIALRSKAGRSRPKNRRKTTKLSRRITPIFCVPWVRYVRRINWKFAHVRGAQGNLTQHRQLR